MKPGFTDLQHPDSQEHPWTTDLVPSGWQAWKARFLTTLMLQLAIAPMLVIQAAATESERHANLQPGIALAAIAPDVGGSTLYAQNSEPIPVETAVRIVPVGTRLRTVYTQAERIVLAPDEQLDLTLEVVEPIETWNGQGIIPAGTLVEGTIQPDGNGMRFVARQLIFADPQRDPAPLAASSQLITETEEISRGTDVGAILRGAAIGAGASLLLQLLTGDRKANILTVLGGAVVGAGAGWAIDGRQEVEVFVIDSNQDLDVTLDAELRLPQTVTP